MFSVGKKQKRSLPSSQEEDLFANKEKEGTTTPLPRRERKREKVNFPLEVHVRCGHSKVSWWRKNRKAAQHREQSSFPFFYHFCIRSCPGMYLQSKAVITAMLWKAWKIMACHQIALIQNHRKRSIQRFDFLKNINKKLWAFPYLQRMFQFGLSAKPLFFFFFKNVPPRNIGLRSEVYWWKLGNTFFPEWMDPWVTRKLGCATFFQGKDVTCGS